jgi:hypothetical protein
MKQAHPYRTTYSRALFRNASSGFNARYLDADDWDFIESVRKHGCVGCSLGDFHRTYTPDFPTYMNEEEACEAYALQMVYREAQSPEEINAYFSVASHLAHEERKEHEIFQARRRAAYARAIHERKEQLAELERVNHEETTKFRARELQTAEMERDWARIERDEIIAQVSRDRRDKHRALKAAERELRRANKFLKKLKRRLHEHNGNGSEGHPRHPGQDEQDLGAGREQNDLGSGSQAADQPRSDDAGITEGGHCGGALDAIEDPTNDSGSRSLAH